MMKIYGMENPEKKENPSIYISMCVCWSVENLILVFQMMMMGRGETKLL